MKAILVIDMPNNCEDCPCFYDWLHCQAKDGLCVIGDGRPEGCPLKPMPPKLDENDWHRMFSGRFSEREAKGYGWNACLEEIDGD